MPCSLTWKAFSFAYFQDFQENSIEIMSSETRFIIGLLVSDKWAFFPPCYHSEGWEHWLYCIVTEPKENGSSCTYSDLAWKWYYIDRKQFINNYGKNTFVSVLQCIKLLQDSFIWPHHYDYQIQLLSVEIQLSTRCCPRDSRNSDSNIK